MFIRRRVFLTAAAVLALVALPTAPAGAGHNPDVHSPNMALVADFANATGAINSDLAFWGNLAYAGNYGGFRIFDISDPANPVLIKDFACFGPQNDPVVWSHGGRTLLFLAIDRTLAGPDCGSPAVAHDDPNGWEGVRIFDVTNPASPSFIKGVYLDCGAHTITLWPKNPAQVLIYASSYPLRPGPTCGAVRGPEAGRDPLHGVIQVIKVPVNNPGAAKEIAEPPITYVGDPDNQFVWADHGLGVGGADIPGLEHAARACHDISVFVELNLAAGACNEQGQLWRVLPNGLPDTAHPIWVFDDVADLNGATGDPGDTEVVVDFFHSATFSWDGSVVNFIDESFGDGCPPTTPAPGSTAGAGYPGDSGRMFFLDAGTGALLSTFMKDPRGETGYCSAHLGAPVASTEDLLVNAWYMGGVDIIDFSDPTAPLEVAWYDVAPAGPTGGDNWSGYWYEGPSQDLGTLSIYASDGVHLPASVSAAGRGFNVFRVDMEVDEVNLDHMNPQTQERVIE